MVSSGFAFFPSLPSLVLITNLGQDRTGKGGDPCPAVLGCDATEQGRDEEVVGSVDVYWKRSTGASGQSEEEGGRRSPWSDP